MKRVSQMFDMFACVTAVVFIALGALSFYRQVVDKTSIYDIPFQQLNPLNLLRFILCGFVLSGITLLIVHLNFPDTRWKDQILVGVGIGLLPGLLIGWAWQLIAHKALCNYLRRYVVIAVFFSAAFFSGIFASSMLSELNREQMVTKQITSIHSLANRDIRRIDIKFESSQIIHISGTKHIELLKNILAGAESSHLNQENGSKNLKIEIHTDTGDMVYDAFIIENDQDNIMLKTSKKGVNIVICLPGLKRWLDENVLNKRD